MEEKEKKYTISLKGGKNGILSRVNEGFTAIELLGLCNLISLEIMQQMKGDIKPDIIKREVVIEEDKDDN